MVKKQRGFAPRSPLAKGDTCVFQLTQKPTVHPARGSFRIVVSTWDQDQKCWSRDTAYGYPDCAAAEKEVGLFRIINELGFLDYWIPITSRTTNNGGIADYLKTGGVAMFYLEFINRFSQQFSTLINENDFQHPSLLAIMTLHMKTVSNKRWKLSNKEGRESTLRSAKKSCSLQAALTFYQQLIWTFNGAEGGDELLFLVSVFIIFIDHPYT